TRYSAGADPAGYATECAAGANRRRRSIAGGAVDDLPQRLAVEEAPQVLDEQSGDNAVAVRVRSADMRQHYDALGGPEFVLFRQWLLAGHVEHRAAEELGSHCLNQVTVVDKVAAAKVQQPCRFLHLPKPLGIDEVVGLRRRRQK